MDGTINKEVVFTFGTQSYSPYQYLSTTGALYGLGFRPSHSADESLIRSYEEGDLRKKAYFLEDVPAKKAENWWEVFAKAASWRAGFFRSPCGASK